MNVFVVLSIFLHLKTPKMDLKWPFFKHSNVFSPYNPKLYVSQITFEIPTHLKILLCKFFHGFWCTFIVCILLCLCVLGLDSCVSQLNKSFGLGGIQGSIVSFGFYVWTTMVVGVNMVMHKKYPIIFSP